MQRHGRLALLLAVLPCALAAGSSVASAQPVELAAPYEYLGWGDPQCPLSVMQLGGVKDLTLAFMLSHGSCNPEWDGYRPLAGGADQAAIEAIRGAGGDVDVSFGGWSGKKLGSSCKSVSALAGAYQRVIDAYSLKAIDIDIEHTEFTNKKTTRTGHRRTRRSAARESRNRDLDHDRHRRNGTRKGTGST